jgi:uncharacterized protein YceK
MRVHACLAALVLAAALLSGCSETRSYRSYADEVDNRTYGQTVGIVFKDWALDFVDIFGIEVGGGETIGINLQPTEFLQMGFLFSDVMKMGLRDRSCGFYRDVRKEGGLSWFYYRDMQFYPLIGTRSLFDRPRVFKGFPLRFNNEWHWLDFGGEVGLVFIQFSAHVSPKQALDFLVDTVLLPYNLGIKPGLASAGVRLPEIDICEDDTAAEIRRKYQFELIRHPEMFEPGEVVNDMVRLPY